MSGDNIFSDWRRGHRLIAVFDVERLYDLCSSTICCLIRIDCSVGERF